MRCSSRTWTRRASSGIPPGGAGAGGVFWRAADRCDAHRGPGRAAQAAAYRQAGLGPAAGRARRGRFVLVRGEVRGPPPPGDRGGAEGAGGEPGGGRAAAEGAGGGGRGRLRGGDGRAGRGGGGRATVRLPAGVL